MIRESVDQTADEAGKPTWFKDNADQFGHVVGFEIEMRVAIEDSPGQGAGIGGAIGHGGGHRHSDSPYL